MSTNVITSTKTRLCVNYQKLKLFTINLLKVKLKINKIDNCSRVRVKKNYLKYLIFEKNA